MTKQDLIKQNIGVFYLPRKIKKKWKKLLLQAVPKNLQHYATFIVLPYLINPKFNKLNKK